MSDIVERLRDLPLLYRETGDEAAAEIERLRTALQEIEALNGRAAISDAGKIMRALNIARRALEPKP